MDNELQKKLDHYFEISTIEKDAPFFTRDIRRKIIQKIDSITDELNDFLHPGTSFTLVHDAHHLTEEDSVLILDSLKSFSALQKKHSLLELESVDSLEEEFLSLAVTLYEKHLEALKALFSRLSASYKQETITEKIHYLG